LVGFDCVPSTPAATCPSIRDVPQCENPNYRRDANGCIIGFDCNRACLEVITPAVDDAGHCKEFQNSCLPPGWKRVDGCNRFIAPKCGDGKCDIGEDVNNCHDDCGPYDYRRNQPRDYKNDFPTSSEITCPDGTKVSCGQTSSGERYCDQCPVSVPDGCRQEKDNNGFIRVVCSVEKKCPDIPQDVRLKCVDQKGIPVFKKDPSGCESFFCQFGNEVSSPFAGYQQCPGSQQIDEQMKKCSSLGLKGIMTFEGGCKIARCVEEKQQDNCGMIPGPEREKIEVDCKAKGLGTVSRFEGCKQIIECGSSTEQSMCAKEMPSEAYQKCSESSGELVVQRSDNGCIRFSKCIQQGDVTDTYVEKPTSIPDSTELLSLAFKLESLNIDLDKLAKKTNDIAEYYKSTGSSDEARFRRVSDMFSTAKNKVEEIKNKIKSRLDTMTEDDVVEIKRDIKYLKEIILKRRMIYK
jgi:polyhydroxyalkanoate synthesis regulator phasin